MTDTNSTTTDALDAGTKAESLQSGVDAGSSGAPAQPSNPENAENKAEAGASISGEVETGLRRALAIVQAERDELREYAANLSKQLLLEKVAAAPAPATIFANSEEEITALKQRIHDGLADAKAAGERYADLVHARHPGRTLSQFVSSTFAHARELLRLS